MVKLTQLLFWNGYHNIPKKFISRKMFKGVVYENTHGITPPVVYNYTKDWVYTENAPWTTAAEQENDPRMPRKQVFVPPLRDFFFHRGDRVQIMNGKDAGKQGSVVGIVKERNWVFVQGLNCKLNPINLSSNASEIAYQQLERPLVVGRDVKLVDKSDLKPTEVVYRYTKDGEKVRVSKRTGNIIPIPEEAEATIDYKKKSEYTPGVKDTEPVQVVEKTFVPRYKTFEQELTEIYCNDDESKKERAPTFIY